MEVAKIKYALIVCVLYHLMIQTEFALLLLQNSHYEHNKDYVVV